MRFAAQWFGFALMLVGVYLSYFVFVQIWELAREPQGFQEPVTTLADMLDERKFSFVQHAPAAADDQTAVAEPNEGEEEVEAHQPNNPGQFELTLGNPGGMLVLILWYMLAAYIPLKLITTGGWIIGWAGDQAKQVRQLVEEVARLTQSSGNSPSKGSPSQSRDG